jgi:hypothetical protein
MVARREGTRSGRSRDEVWRELGDLHSQDNSIQGSANALTAENPLHLANSRHQLPDAPSPLVAPKKSPDELRRPSITDSTAQMLLFIALLYSLQGKLEEAPSDRVALNPHTGGCEIWSEW